MREIMDYIRSEPARLLSLLAAGFALLAAFGLELTKEQVGAIMAFVSVLVGIIVRQAVTPNIKVAAKEQENPGAGPQTELVAGPAADVDEDEPVEVIPAHPGYDGTNL